METCQLYSSPVQCSPVQSELHLEGSVDYYAMESAGGGGGGGGHLPWSAGLG